MTKTSRLDAAKEREQSDEAAWFRSPLVLVAIGILFLGALALVAVGFSGGGSSDEVAVEAAAPEPVAIAFGGPGAAEVDAVTVVGDALPVLGTGDDAAVGLRAPQVTASSLANGNAITLSEGRARVIGFFAHWRPHCQAELPEITEWLADNRLPPNTEFIAVSTMVNEDADNFPPSQWFTDVGFNSPVLVDDADQSLLQAFGFQGFPAFVAIDSSGAVIERAGGNIGTDGLADLFSNFAS